MITLRERLRLYVIPDIAGGHGRPLAEQAEKALLGGATALQLRIKDASRQRRLEEATALRALCTRFGALFFVNDDLDVALASDADGVHLGQNDPPLPPARARAPRPFLIGASVQTVEDAIRAEAAGADYLGVGAVFPTRSKVDAVLTGLDVLRAIAGAVAIPIVAIGGITPENADRAHQAGACGVAVISSVVGAPDIVAAAKRFSFSGGR